MHAAVHARAALAAVLLSGASLAGTVNLSGPDDTFVNSTYVGNNNGGSTSLFTGLSGQAGTMRAFVRFALPAGLAGRADVSGSEFKLTTRGLGSTESQAPTAATITLRAVVSPWGEGIGAGTMPTTFVVGEPCSGSEATWSQPQCTTGTWSFAAASSGSFNSPASIATVTTASGAGLDADVQRWIDTPAGNQGWLLTSNAEGGPFPAAQRYFSSESVTSGPSLSFLYNCKPGFQDTGTTCTACTTTAQDACVVSAAGNACVDLSPPATYSCACGNPGYALGTNGQGQAVCVPRVFDIDANGSYDAFADGVLILRYLFGLTGNALTDNALAGNATRATGDIQPYLDSTAAALDVDDDTHLDPLTDGLLIVRYMLGLRGDALSDGLVTSGAQRTGSAIDDYLQSQMP